MSNNDTISRKVVQANVAEFIENNPQLVDDWTRDMIDFIIEENPPIEHPKAKNIGTDYGEQDQFICSECSIHLQDWVRIDEDDYEDGIVHEYVFRFCPNCGAKIEADN